MKHEEKLARAAKATRTRIPQVVQQSYTKGDLQKTHTNKEGDRAMRRLRREEKLSNRSMLVMARAEIAGSPPEDVQEDFAWAPLAPYRKAMLNSKLSRDPKKVTNSPTTRTVQDTRITMENPIEGRRTDSESDEDHTDPESDEDRVTCTNGTLRIAEKDDEALANVEAGGRLQDLSTMKATRQCNEKRALQYCSMRWVVASTD
jgi:hypothetical protein